MGKVTITDEAGSPSTPADGLTLYSIAGVLYYKDDGGTLHEVATDQNLPFTGNITSTMLATDAVETAKIKDANVTAAKLATDAVETAKIKDANVTAAKLATDAVETAKIKDANVTTAKLLDANVTLAKLGTDVTALIASQISNLVWDEINLHVEDTSNWNGLPWWEGAASITIVDDGSNPYGGKVLRTTVSAKGKGIYLDQVGLQPGDVISAGLMCMAASGTYNLRLIFRTTGPGATAVSTVNGSGHAFSGDTYALVANNVTIPATANWVSIVPYSAAPTSIDIYAIWLHRGAVAAAAPTPSPFTATYLRLKEWETSAQRLMVRNVDTSTFYIYQPQHADQSWIRWKFVKLATDNWTYYGADACSDNAGAGAYSAVTFDIGYSIYYTPDGQTGETCGNHHLYDNFTSVNFYNEAGDTVDPTASGAAFQCQRICIEQKGTLRHPDTAATDHATISRFIEISVDQIYEHMRLSWLTDNNTIGYWNTGQLLAGSATKAYIHNNGDAAFIVGDPSVNVTGKTRAYTWYASRKFTFEVDCPTAEAIQLRETTLKVYPRTIQTDVTRDSGDVDHAEWYWRVIWDKTFEQRI